MNDRNNQDWGGALEREEKLRKKLAQLEKMEADIKEKEKALKQKEKGRKQLILRLSPSLWEDIAAWAEEDFRSINGQIEYLLTECVKKRKKGKKEQE